jgi:hypothetical protein
MLHRERGLACLQDCFKSLSNIARGIAVRPPQFNEVLPDERTG